MAARQEEKQCVGRMEFKTFVNHFIQLPCQVLRTGRRIVCRLLSWNRRLDIFFRWLDSLPRPKPTAIRASRRVAAMRC